MLMKLPFEIISLESDQIHTIEFEPRMVVCAEFSSGRQVLGGDQKFLLNRVEASRFGTAPHFCPVSPYLLTHENRIVVQGKHTSGEVEYVAIRHQDEIYISVGSDHSDRQAESFSLAMSKQLCPKVVARQAILHRELRPHRDGLKLSASVQSHDRIVPYQQGSLADLMRLGSLIRNCPFDLNFNGAVLFSGTLPTISGIPSFSRRFYFQMDLPGSKLSISHDYEVEVLPESP
jgi:hypothetical protein